jgi:3',5'-cyclic AMP phosphodiesterase CpdA
MKVLAQISDLHFGTEDPVVEAALLEELQAAAPSLIAVSGDLTQRARPSEFAASRAFLDRLPGPYLVVPGNHDIPLYDVIHRFARPFARYEQYITDDLAPTHADDELVVAGVTTAHPFTIKGGKITRPQIETVRTQLSGRDSLWKIVVAHHPFVVPAGVAADDVVDGVALAVPAFEAVGVDLILSGHLHVGFAADVAGFRTTDRRMISVNAGTCISTRRRGEPNGYNRLTFEGNDVAIVHRRWDGERFVDGPAKTYRYTRQQLVKLQAVIPPESVRGGV